MTSLTAHDVHQLLAAEQFVRKLARSLVGGDADEVVQRAWLKALRHDGSRVREPQRWLARIVRSVAANLCRSDGRRRVHEEAASRRELAPSSLRLLELEETRRSLVAAVDTLPADLRRVVLLRYYDGLPPRAIARELGVPVAVVWRQQQRALALLRARFDADAEGDRRAWMLALAPLAAAPRGLPWCELTQPAAPAFWAGVLVMTTKTKILGGAAMLLAMTLLLVLGTRPGEPAAASPAARAAPSVAQTDVTRIQPSDPAVAAPEREAAHVLETPAASGTLIVHVRYADDQTPAAGEMVLAWSATIRRIWGAQRLRTDDRGTAVFVGLRPGRTLVTTGRNLSGIGSGEAEVRAEATTELDLELAGFTLSGIVVNAAGTPVAGALVEMMPPLATLPEPVATTGPDGRFRVRAVRSPNLVGARAAGYASSECLLLMQDPGPTEMQLVLNAAGGTVEGLVVGPDGPVAGAAVQVGPCVESGRMRNPPQPALVHTDGNGCFRAIGVAIGEQPVQVRVAGLAPWRGTCEVAAEQTTSLRVQLQPGAVIRGVARDAGGAPVSDASVSIGRGEDPLAWFAARSRSDGTFAFADLPAEELEVKAAHERAGRAAVRVHTAPGAVAECELHLSRGLELHGRVLREDDTPVAGASVFCWGGSGGIGSATTDAIGRFAIANCPQGTVSVSVEAPGIERLPQQDVDTRSGEVELRVRSVAAPSATMRGRVVDPDGRPLAGLTVEAGRRGTSVALASRATTGADGRFEFGPLVPGTWWLSIDAEGYPGFEDGPIALGADAVHDAGTIQLAKGGTVRARIVAGDPTGVRFQARRAGRFMGELQLGAGEVVSGLLLPGDCELSVFGNGTAAQTIPFAIRPGEETRLELRLERGVRQRLEVAIPAASVAAGEEVHLLVHRDGALVWRLSRSAPTSAKASLFTEDVWLLAGSYTLTATWGSRRATAPFAVGAEEGPAVSVELR